MTIVLLSRQNGSENMTQNLCSKQEPFLQPQEKDIKRFSNKPVGFFSGDISYSR